MHKKEIENLARSLMLEIKEKDMNAVNKEFDSFLVQVEQINLIDTDNVEPLNYPFEDAVGQLREDVEGDVLTLDEVLCNSAETFNDMVKIPKVVVW